MGGLFSRFETSIVGISLVLLMAVELFAQPAETLATVDGVKITRDQVERDLQRSLRDLKLGPAEKEAAFQATLEKLVHQHVVFSFLQKHRVAAGEQEVNLRLSEMENDLATVETSIEDYLEQSNQTMDELRFQIAWQFSWKKYLDRKLTDEFLEAHFNQYKRQLDGTELRVAHLLLKAPDQPDPDTLKKLSDQADEIARQIATSSLTFETAVAKHSDAPTNDSGGEIGWIQVDGPMPPNFTAAAFELSVGQTSGPVTTRFGVHLIKCLEIKEGKLGWRDVIDEVKRRAARAYFDAIADKHRSEMKIEYASSVGN